MVFTIARRLYLFLYLEQSKAIILSASIGHMARLYFKIYPNMPGYRNEQGHSKSLKLSSAILIVIAIKKNFLLDCGRLDSGEGWGSFPSSNKTCPFRARDSGKDVMGMPNFLLRNKN